MITTLNNYFYFITFCLESLIFLFHTIVTYKIFAIVFNELDRSRVRGKRGIVGESLRVFASVAQSSKRTADSQASTRHSEGPGAMQLLREDENEKLQKIA